ncbi:hypothetical protein ACFFIF_08235 [Vagococcus entomophilus]|uniref:Lipoprotein n=1 Tax=Vagococcus entomophilus TaxID=1160095 RepID=A0A430AH65_9ENTE|nr:hypothetical protein [Vagococcus entomophilus]RSU07251.1 hypothetical protein CBF30_08330 [Vagococcus entomophilus]
MKKSVGVVISLSVLLMMGTACSKSNQNETTSKSSEGSQTTVSKGHSSESTSANATTQTEESTSVVASENQSTATTTSTSATVATTSSSTISNRTETSSTTTTSESTQSQEVAPVVTSAQGAVDYLVTNLPTEQISKYYFMAFNNQTYQDNGGTYYIVNFKTTQDTSPHTDILGSYKVYTNGKIELQNY